MSIQNKEKIERCWLLYKNKISPEEIPKQIGVHRATVYRWIKGIKKKRSVEKFLMGYEQAKRGRRKRKTDVLIKKKIYRIREEYHGCCGEKIVYILKKEYGESISRSTVYRILNEKYQLRSKWKKNQKRGQVITGTRPKELIQVDSVVLGELYAFTAIDTYTRKVEVTIAERLDSLSGKEALQRIFENIGKPKRIQRDGGPEFKLEWQALAEENKIAIRTARPYKKNEQAYIERFNGILRKECVGHIAYKKEHKQELEKQVSEYLDYYHNKRPHLALGMQTPSEFIKNYSMSHLT